jgi:hypothetical protein
LDTSHLSERLHAFSTIAVQNRFNSSRVIDGPDLAEEVAQLEGLPVEWKTLEKDDLKAYESDHLTLTPASSNWRLYTPHAEQDAQMAAEGLHEPSLAAMPPEKDRRVAQHQRVPNHD